MWGKSAEIESISENICEWDGSSKVVKPTEFVSVVDPWIYIQNSSQLFLDDVNVLLYIMILKLLIG